MNLKDFQLKWQELVIDSQSEDEGFLNQNLIPAGQLNSVEGFDVYINGYYTRLTESLGEIYEAVWSVLGDKLFFEICRDYILKNPSLSHNLSHYGVDFPYYLSQLALNKKIQNFIPDLARFEKIFYETFHEIQHSKVNFKKEISKLKEGSNFKLNFCSSFRLFESDYEVDEIWKSRHERQMPFPFMGQTKQHLTLYKKNHQISILPLGAVEFSILSKLTSGQSFLESVSAHSDELEPTQIQRLFETISECGFVTECEAV